MLKKISFMGFKGKILGEVELKPLTLLFGPNSAGKSTIIQVIHYAKEILERRNFSPRGTKLGGNAIDLGGFKNFVFAHNLEIPIHLNFEFDLSKRDLPGAQEIEENKSEPDPFSMFSSNVKTAHLSIIVQWLENLNRAEATMYSVRINDEDFATINLDYDNPKNIQPYFSEINIHHKLSQDGFTSDEDGLFLGALGLHDVEYKDDFRLNIKNSISAIPNFEKGIELEQEVLTPEELNWFDDSETPHELHENYKGLMLLYRQVMISVGLIAKEELSRFIYIGPIREIPTRNFEPHFEDEIERWANGLAAWDIILSNKVDVTILNDWLERLKIDYRFEHKKDLSKITIDELIALNNGSKEDLLKKLNNFFETSDTESPLFKSGMEFQLYKQVTEEFEKLEKKIKNKLSNNSELALVENRRNIEVKPYDVGIGISQVLPIIVAVLTQKSPILSIEQPELHIHPALQVELADLFISALNKDPEAIYILETHSEHLMLRFLKRVRDTQKNKDKEFNLHPDKLGVYVINQSDGGVDFSMIKIDERGKFKNNWPKGFFDERHGELF